MSPLKGIEMLFDAAAALEAEGGAGVSLEIYGIIGRSRRRFFSVWPELGETPGFGPV